MPRRCAKRLSTSTAAAKSSECCRSTCSARSRSDDFIDAIPSTATAIAVLDRTKEPGASGEPLYQDVVTAFAEAVAAGRTTMPRILGGRYGLASKEFTPAMVKAVFDNLAAADPKHHFTVGIRDDVSHTSLDYDAGFRRRKAATSSAASSTVSEPTARSAPTRIRSRSSERTRPGYAQGFFVYDSKKSGSRTTSHLRFGPRPIRSAYLVQRAQLHRLPSVSVSRSDRPAARGDGRRGVPRQQPVRPGSGLGSSCRAAVQEDLIRKRIRLFVIDADRVAVEAGMAGRINTIMQTCFFAISGVLPRDEAIAANQGRRRRDLRPKGHRARRAELRRD